MGRLVDVDDLIGTPEIAERLDVGHVQTVTNWERRHPDFPRPVIHVRHVKLWLWPDIEAWARSTGRLPSQDRPTL